jgi:flagellar biosynthetic protein FliP
MINKNKILSLLRVGGLFVAAFVFLAASPCFAQSLNLDVGQGPTTSARLVQIILLVTVLSLAPSILVMVTSFTRMVVVLSFLRTALGTQQTPPSVVLVSLALFLTMFVMQPTFDQAWESGIRPLMNGQIDEETAFNRAAEPFHDFMLKHTREKDLKLFVEMSKPIAKEDDKKQEAIGNKDTAPKKTDAEAKDDVSMRALIPAFMISELRRAFEIGFLLFLPFLIIDMVVASILMAMGMAMLPPSIISLPFKIIFFVLVDGWYLIAGSLVQSYGG